MKPVIFPLILAGIVSLVSAADPKPTAADYLALYSVVPDDAFNRDFATRFEFEDVFSGVEKPKKVRGMYRGDPVLTFEHVAKVDMETREISTAPISGIRFDLSDSGAKKLHEYLSQPGAKDMVVFIDGYPCATVPLDLARQMNKSRVLWVVLPRPWEPVSQRYLVLLIEKLQSKITKK